MQLVSPVLYLTVIGDEADIIAENLTHHYDMGFRHFYIMFNRSGDATRRRAEAAAAGMGDAQFRFFTDDRIGYWQPERLTEMAEEGYKNGHRWMFPRDADELLQWGRSPDLPTAGRNACPTSWRGVLNRIDSPGFIRCRWHDFAPHEGWNGECIFDWRAELPEPRPQSKLIVRWKPGMAFGLDHHLLREEETEIENPGFRVAHYPFRSREFLERKIAQIGKAFIERYGEASKHGQVRNYLKYLADPEGWMDRQWAWVLEYRGKACQ